MKLTIAKSDLQDALRVVTACKSSTGSDLSSHYLFKVNPPDPNKKDAPLRVTIAAYSGQTFASSPVKAAVEGDDADAFTIEGWRLEKWLGAIPDDGKAVTFSYEPAESKTVETKSTKSTQWFDSLDPTKFPSWDMKLAESKVTATMPAALLHSILGYAQNFVGDDDTKHPEQTVIECRKVALKKNASDPNEKPEEVGVVFAMDGMHAVQIRCSLLKDCTLRIYGKNVKGILSFLTFLKDGVVDLLEDQPGKDAPAGAETTTLFLRQHAAPGEPVSVYGENRFTTPFPDLGTPEAMDHYLWKLPKDEAIGAIPALESGADEKDTKLRFTREGTDTVRMSMKTLGSRWAPYDITSDSLVQTPNAPSLPPDGFMVNKNSFKAALRSMPGDAPKVGVNKLGRGGYLRFVREEGPKGEMLLDGKLNGIDVPATDRTIYLTVVAWMK